ncbi:hypothetical protein ACC758_39135, partial [Rhizobium ruizarguesonis]
GELVSGLYYDTSGIRSLSIRIGNAGTYPNSERSDPEVPVWADLYVIEAAVDVAPDWIRHKLKISSKGIEEMDARLKRHDDPV